MESYNKDDKTSAYLRNAIFTFVNTSVNIVFNLVVIGHLLSQLKNRAARVPKDIDFDEIEDEITRESDADLARSQPDNLEEEMKLNRLSSLRKT